jgi:hypothetical protein
MNRGLAVALAWRLPYWQRVSPGLAGGILHLILPLLFFLPLEVLPLFEEQLRGVAMLLWLFAVAFALGVAAKRGAREEDAIWLFQKGVSLGETALEDWLLDSGLSVVAAFWWASLGTLALLGSGQSLGWLWLSLFALGLVTATVTQTLVFVLSAWGLRRSVDLTVLAVLLSMVAPVLVFQSSNRVQAIVGWVIPPFKEAWVLAGALRTGDFLGVAAALLHVLVFVGLFLALGVVRISRWKPHG